MSKKIEMEDLRRMIDKLFWDESMGDFDTESMLEFMVMFDLLNTKRILIVEDETVVNNG